jgi:uncharacterized tellurite resistance protein B-like protein
MTEAAKGGPHPARGLPEPQRIDYLTAVGSILFADGTVSESELEKLRHMCLALELSPAGVEEVIGAFADAGGAQLSPLAAAGQQPDPARVSRIVAGYRNKDLRFTLLTDAIVMAYADGRIDEGESEEIASWAEALQISTAQAVLIARYVAQVVSDEGEGDDKDLSKELAAGLAEHANQVPNKGSIRWLFVKLGGK